MKTISCIILISISLMFIQCEKSREFDVTLHSHKTPYTVMGTLKATYGEPVPYANIYYRDHRSISDCDGNYFISIDEDNGGEGQLKIIKEEFEDFQSNLFLYRGVQTFNVRLKLEPIVPKFKGYIRIDNEISTNIEWSIITLDGVDPCVLIVLFDLRRFVGMDIKKAEFGAVFSTGDYKVDQGVVEIRQIPLNLYWTYDNIGDLNINDVNSYPLLGSTKKFSLTNNQSQFMTIDIFESFTTITRGFGLNNGFILTTNKQFYVESIRLDIE